MALSRLHNFDHFQSPFTKSNKTRTNQCPIPLPHKYLNIKKQKQNKNASFMTGNLYNVPICSAHFPVPPLFLNLLIPRDYKLHERRDFLN